MQYVLLLESNGDQSIHLVAGPSNLTLLAGESVQLECAVSMPSSRDLHIIWARQGTTLQLWVLVLNVSLQAFEYYCLIFVI